MPTLIRLLLAALLLLMVQAQAAPRVRLPNGELTDSNTDIQVKILGGGLSVRRTWTNGRWYFNPLWADLKFKIDSTSGQVKYVDRAGTVFERTGNGDVYRFDSNQFVRRVTPSGDWRWYDRMGNYALYSATGILREYADKHGVKVTIQSNADNKPEIIRDHFGTAALTFTYAGTKLDRVTDRTGRYVQYTWVGDALTEVRDTMGYVWKYGYDGNGQLNEITDPEQQVTKVTYTQSFVAGALAAPLGVSFTGRPGRDFRISRVATLEDPLHRITRYQYEYARDRRQFTVIETTPAPISRTLERIYDIEGRLVKSLSGTRREFERRADGPLVDYVKNERGLVTRSERDSYRNVIEVQHPDGTKQQWKYLPALSYVSEYTDELGVRSTYSYDAKGRVLIAVQAVGTPIERTVEYSYTAYGQLETRTLKGDTVALDVITRMEYDNYGNLTKTTDAEDQITLTTHDVMGNVLTQTDARSKTRVMTYNAAGWLQTSKTPLQFLTTFEYDQTGNRTKSKAPIDGTRSSDTIYRYDDKDRLVETEDPLGGLHKQRYDEEGQLYESEDARAVITRVGFDASSRMTTMTDGNGNTTETIYGDEGNALEGLVAKHKYPTYEETYKYDQRDRQIEVKQTLSPTLSYTSTMAYDAMGNVVSQTDAKGRTRQRFYDALHRVIKDVDPILGETRYTYDHRDNLLTVTDANSNTHRFSYDKINRKTTEARPMGQTIGYVYDPNGNLIERTSPNGAKRIYTYDDDNRLEREQHFAPATATASKTIAYTYDQRGLLKTYDDGLTSGTYIYDDKGQKTGETITFGNGAGSFAKTLTRSYEANGLPKTLTYPGSTGTLNFAYDSNNQLQTYKIPGLAMGNDTLTYAYRWNAIQSVTMPGNLTRTVTLDALQRPERIQVNGTGNNGEPVMDHRYLYDEVSNITRKTTLDGAYVYAYDDLDRLTGATPPPSLISSPSNPDGLPDEAYSYDNVHNRLTSAHQPGPWIYNANNELKQWGVGEQQETIDYDANGSTIKEDTGNPAITATREYVYDAQDRMVEVKDSGATIAKYAYDPMGRRVWRQTFGADASVTWFLFSGEGLIGEYGSVSQAIREYGWPPDGVWGTDPVWQKDVNGTHLAQNDHLFISDALTSSTSGVQSWDALRQSFGTTTERNPAQTDFLLRFPGQYSDVKSGMNYNYYRDYNPKIGAYIQSDPISLRAVSFVYARQNPVARFDNRGLWEVSNYLPDMDINTIYCNNGSSEVHLGDPHSGEKGRCLNGGILLHENIHKSRFDRSSSAGKCRRFPGKASIGYTNMSECDNEERIALKDQREHYEKMLSSSDCPEACAPHLRVEIQYISNILAQSVVPYCRCDDFWFEGGKLKCMMITIGNY